MVMRHHWLTCSFQREVSPTLRMRGSMSVAGIAIWASIHAFGPAAAAASISASVAP